MLSSISKEICRISQTIKLKHQVTLTTKSKEGKCLSHQYAKSYNSAKYVDKKQLTSLTINTGDFLIIEDTSKNSIYISYPHIVRLLEGLKNVIEWFELEDLFLEDKKGNIDLNADYELKEEIIEMVGGKSIVIEPTIFEDNGEQLAGVSMFLNTFDVENLLTVDELLALEYFIKNFNLYESSNQLIIMSNQYINRFVSTSSTKNNGEVKPKTTTVRKKTVKKKVVNNEK